MGKKILITGGTSGIGLATANLFAGHGHDVCITGLNQQELDDSIAKILNQHPGAEVQGFVIDLSTQGSFEEFRIFVQHAGINPDVVIHNAGFGTWGYLSDISEERELAMMQLMVMNVYRSTRYFLNCMEKKGGGTIINIASISAFQASPTLTTYGACKAFIYQFSRALSAELRMKRSPVKCLVICPTPVNTAFQRQAGMQGSALFHSWMTVTPEIVARSIYNGWRNGNDFLIPGRFFMLLSSVSRRLPESWQIRLAAFYLRPLQ